MSCNLLHIVCDQFQARYLGFMGHPTVRTPNLDRLAAESVVFDSAFTPSPVCMAARGTLMTGRYPAAIRIRGMGVLPPWETTTAEVLRRHGYRTGAFGKTHITPELYTHKVLKSDVPILDPTPFLKDAEIPAVDDPAKEQYGFDEHVGCDDANRGNHEHWLAERAPELLEKEAEHPFDAPGDLWVSPYPSEHHHSTYIAELTTDFIRRQGRDPWFAHSGFIHPHHPFEAPQDQIDRYAVADIPMPRISSSVEREYVPEPMASAIDECEKYSDDVMRRIIHHYMASISLIDDNVGRLLDVLEATGQRDNTIIVFTSDHG